MLEQDRQGNQEPARADQGQTEEWQQQSIQKVASTDGLNQDSNDPLRLRDRIGQDLAGRMSQPLVEGQVIDRAGIQGRRNDFGAEDEPANRQRAWPNVPLPQLGCRSLAFQEKVNGAVSRDEKSHVFLAGKEANDPQPVETSGIRKSPVNH